MECIDLDNYRASLAHKANHSFSPNCKFVAGDHPRKGLKAKQVEQRIGPSEPGSGGFGSTPRFWSE